MENNEMHLTQDEEAKNILELGFCLIQAYQRLKSFVEEAEKMLDGTKLHINEIVILHIIRIHNKPKSVNVIYLIADFYDELVERPVACNRPPFRTTSCPI